VVVSKSLLDAVPSSGYRCTAGEQTFGQGGFESVHSQGQGQAAVRAALVLGRATPDTPDLGADAVFPRGEPVKRFAQAVASNGAAGAGLERTEYAQLPESSPVRRASLISEPCFRIVAISTRSRSCPRT
jgi:hypothetical protein